MYDETNVPGPEFKVRPVVRYVVTVYYHPYESRDGKCSMSGSSEVIGEFAREDRAEEVRESMQKFWDEQRAAMKAATQTA